MGWAAVVTFPALKTLVGVNGLIFLFFGGGISYTVGVIFYALHKISVHAFYMARFRIGRHSASLFLHFVLRDLIQVHDNKAQRLSVAPFFFVKL